MITKVSKSNGHQTNETEVGSVQKCPVFPCGEDGPATEEVGEEDEDAAGQGDGGLLVVLHQLQLHGLHLPAGGLLQLRPQSLWGKFSQSRSLTSNNSNISHPIHPIYPTTPSTSNMYYRLHPIPPMTCENFPKLANLVMLLLLLGLSET